MNSMVRCLLLLAMAQLLPPPVSAQCIGTDIGQAGASIGTPTTLSAGNTIAVLHVVNPFGITPFVRFIRRQPDGSLVELPEATGFGGFGGSVRGVTFDGSRVQLVVTGGLGQTRVVELERGAAGGGWALHETPLSGRWAGYGELLARDGGRWAALTYELNDELVVDILERAANGRLAIVATERITARDANAHDQVMSVALDGDQLLVGSSAEERGGVRVLSRNAAGRWPTTGLLEQPPGTDRRYLAGFDVDGDICAVARSIATPPYEGIVHVYQRDAADPLGWSLTQTIREPDSYFFPGGITQPYRVQLDASRLFIATPNSLVLQVHELRPNGPAHYDVATTIDGAGGAFTLGVDHLVTPTIGGAARVIDFDEFQGRERAWTCFEVGAIVCDDPLMTLEMRIYPRRIAGPRWAHVVEVRGAPAGSLVILTASPQQAFIPTSYGPFCVGGDPRYATLPLIELAPGVAQVLVDLTALPTSTGLVTALNGETWTFQAVTLRPHRGELSPALAFEVWL